MTEIGLGLKGLLPAQRSSLAHVFAGKKYFAEKVKLESITVIYEERGDWVRRARSHGFTKPAAAEASHWLFPEDEIQSLCASLQSVSSRSQLKVEQINIDTFFKHIDRYYTSARAKDSILWNITDGQALFRGSHVPSIAASAEIPYFGCPPRAQSLGQDKFHFYLLCRAIGVPVPLSALIEGSTTLNSFIQDRRGPFFVKLNSFGNKVGLSKASLCNTIDEALEHAARIGGTFHDRVIIQKFINGPEIRLTYIDAATDDEPRFGYEVVDTNINGSSFVSADERDIAYERYIDATTWEGLPDQVRIAALERMHKSVSLLSQFVLLKDYFTLDFRLDSTGVPLLIDFNPGAFLYGENIDGYARNAFGTSLPDVLFCALENSFQKQRNGLYNNNNIKFRL